MLIVKSDHSKYAIIDREANSKAFVRLSPSLYNYSVKVDKIEHVQNFDLGEWSVRSNGKITVMWHPKYGGSYTAGKTLYSNQLHQVLKHLSNALGLRPQNRGMHFRAKLRHRLTQNATDFPGTMILMENET